MVGRLGPKCRKAGGRRGPMNVLYFYEGGETQKDTKTSKNRLKTKKKPESEPGKKQDQEKTR